MDPFRSAPEFIERDNRVARSFSPVSFQQTLHKHESLLPAKIVRDKTVLDVGCCIGATGHWCLSGGATSYCGVEPQHTYAETARELLERHHPGKATVVCDSMESFFASNDAQYDIVSALGVLHSSTNMYGALHSLALRARHVVAIEEILPRTFHTNPEFVGIEFSEKEGVNLADDNASLLGRGSRISPAGLAFLMQGFGFSAEGPLAVRSIRDTVDNFNAPPVSGNARYLMRFVRTGETPSGAPALGNAARRGTVRPW